MNKKVLSLLLAGIMLISVLAGCEGSSGAPAQEPSASAPSSESPSDAAPSEAVSSKDTLILAISADPSRLRSDSVRGLANRSFRTIVYDYLFISGDDGGYEPWLCKSFELDEDGLGVTLHLEEGVKFHDGNVMTAEDVIASLQIGAADTSYGSVMKFIDFENCKAVDANTAYLKFLTKNGVWQAPLVSVGIIEKAAYEAVGNPDEFYADPMTTAPYVLKNWVSGDSLTFEAFEDYWKGAPKIKNMILRVISESAVSLMELTTGGIDVFYNMTRENYQTASANPELIGYDGMASPTSIFLGMNLNNPALNDLRVRQAIAYAIDLNAICIGAFDSAATPCYSMIGVNALGYDASWEQNYPYQYNPEKAKELLADAGYGDGSLSFTVIVDSTASRQLMAEQLLNMFAEVGITLNISKNDSATATDIVSKTNDYDMYIRGMSVNEGDSITNLTTTVGTKGTHMEADAAHYEDWLRITTSISEELDADKRAEGYKELQKAFIEDMVYWIPGVLQKLYSAYSAKLDGVIIHGGYWYWTNAYFK